jgi:hypothetical protein
MENEVVQPPSVTKDETPVDPKDPHGLLSSRWLWRELGEAQTNEQVLAVLAKVKSIVGDNLITIKIELPVPVYCRIMHCAWVANRFKEINEMSMKAYLDRAMQLMEYNLKNIHLKRNS